MSSTDVTLSLPESPTITTDSKPSPKWYGKLHEKKGLLLGLVSMAMFLDIINVASVTITLPKIREDVGYEPNQLQWVVSAYALAYSGFLLLGGRLGDLLGHRRIFLLGVSWFTIWSLINGFANTPVFMSVGRAMQGMGAGFTIPSALALLTTTYPAGPERTQAIAIFGGTGAVGSVVGVLLGGIFGSTIGWRWIFYITAIVGALTSISGFFIIPAMTHIPPEDKRIDYGGAFSFMVGIVLIIYYLSEGPSAGWAVAKTLVPFIIGLLLLVAFVVIELKIDYPLMPLHIWHSRRFIASTVTAVFISMSIQTFIFFTSLTLQNVLGYSPIITSCAYIVHGVGLIIGVGILTKFILKYVRTKILIAGGWILVVGSGIIWAQVKYGNSYWELPFPGFILNFLGMVPVWVLSQVNSVTDAADEDQGLVGAVYNVALQIGGPIGIAIATVVMNSIVDPNSTGSDLMPGYSAAFYCMAGYSALGFIAVVILAPNQDPVPLAATEVGASTTLEEEEVKTDSASVVGEAVKVTETGRSSLSSERVEEKKEVGSLSVDSSSTF